MSSRDHSPTHRIARVLCALRRLRTCVRARRPLLKTRSTSTDVPVTDMWLAGARTSQRGEGRRTWDRQVVQRHPREAREAAATIRPPLQWIGGVLGQAGEVTSDLVGRSNIDLACLVGEEVEDIGSLVIKRSQWHGQTTSSKDVPPEPQQQTRPSCFSSAFLPA